MDLPPLHGKELPGLGATLTGLIVDRCATGCPRDHAFTLLITRAALLIEIATRLVTLFCRIDRKGY